MLTSKGPLPVTFSKSSGEQYFYGFLPKTRLTASYGPLVAPDEDPDLRRVKFPGSAWLSHPSIKRSTVALC